MSSKKSVLQKHVLDFCVTADEDRVQSFKNQFQIQKKIEKLLTSLLKTTVSYKLIDRKIFRNNEKIEERSEGDFLIHTEKKMFLVHALKLARAP